MIFSVYDPDRKVYTYYEGPGPKGTHAGSPRPRGRSDLGSSPEEAAWSLPASARKVGDGPMPKGRIASASSFGLGLGALGIDADPVHLGIYAALAYLAWRAIR